MKQMITRITMAFAVLLMVFSATSNAGLITLDADYVGSTTGLTVSDFSLIYDDTNDDGLFDLDELVSFSGVQLFLGTNPFGSLVTSIAYVPQIQDIAVQSGVASNSSLDGHWEFGNATITQVFSNFEYTETVGSSEPVPEPASIFVMALGLLGLAYRRKTKV